MLVGCQLHEISTLPQQQARPTAAEATPLASRMLEEALGHTLHLDDANANRICPKFLV